MRLTNQTVEALRADLAIAAAVAEGTALAIVRLLLGAGRTVRANLSLDAIDEGAKAHGLTRLAFLAGAAREKIEEGPLMGYVSTLMRIQSAFENAGIRFLDNDCAFR